MAATDVTAMIWLIIVAVVMMILFALASVYLQVYFSHPEDRGAAHVPRVIVIFGIWLCLITVLMLPFDVANVAFANKAIPMTYVWYAVLLLDVLLIVVVIPFAIFYYEADDPTDATQSQCAQAFKIMVLVMIVVGALYGVSYLFLGRAEINVHVLTSGLHDVPAGQTFEAGLEYRRRFEPFVDASSYEQALKFRVGLILFIVSAVSFLGTALFACFGGIGLTALPFDLINNWRWRPKRLTLEQFASEKLSIGQRATTLLEIGQRITDEQRSRKKRSRASRATYNRFKQAVYVLDEDWRKLHYAQKRRGALLLWDWGQLALGVLATITSLLWIVHIMLYLLLGSPPPLIGFLDDALVAIENGSPVPFGTIFYALLAFYLLVCVLKGNFKFGMRVFVFWAVHPMRIGGTMMNAFLFNVLLLLFSSIAVAQFSTVAFAQFSSKTSANAMFGLTISNLLYIKYVWLFYHIAIIVIAFFTMIFLLVRPSDRIQLERA